MTQRILVVLDPDADTPVATDTAIDIARRYNAEVTGLAFVDKESIGNASIGGGIGSMYYAEKLRERLTGETRDRAHALVRQFVERVEAAGVRHANDHVDEGKVVASLLAEMRTHDLLIAGRESHFYYADPERRTHTLAKLLEQSAGAVLIVGKELTPVRSATLAYDGSASAARAMQKFALLQPYGTDLALEVVHVRGRRDDERLASEALLAGARDYLQAHGFGAVRTSSIEGDRPADLIVQYASGDRADLVVAGAFAKSGLRRMAFGSAATKLIDEAEVPLFLCH